MVVVITGNGKGKTTASLGAALRAIGRGQRVIMGQFIKGPWASGEDYSVKLLTEEILKKSEIGKGGMVFKKMGLGFVGILGDKLPLSDHKNAAKEAMEFFKEAIAASDPEWNMIIMDEVNVAVSLDLITEEEVLEMLEDLPDEKIVILTGRGAPDSFIKRADLVTEMKEVKHPFSQGKEAKINVEF